jgi:putative endonuclease
MDDDAWWLYVLLCANDRLYVGIARNVDARFEAHRAGKGAIYTRLNAPVRIVARQTARVERRRVARRVRAQATQQDEEAGVDRVATR